MDFEKLEIVEIKVLQEGKGLVEIGRSFLREGDHEKTDFPETQPGAGFDCFLNLPAADPLMDPFQDPVRPAFHSETDHLAARRPEPFQYFGPGPDPDVDPETCLQTRLLDGIAEPGDPGVVAYEESVVKPEVAYPVFSRQELKPVNQPFRTQTAPVSAPVGMGAAKTAPERTAPRGDDRKVIHFHQAGRDLGVLPTGKVLETVIETDPVDILDQRTVGVSDDPAVPAEVYARNRLQRLPLDNLPQALLTLAAHHHVQLRITLQHQPGQGGGVGPADHDEAAGIALLDGRGQVGQFKTALGVTGNADQPGIGRHPDNFFAIQPLEDRFHHLDPAVGDLLEFGGQETQAQALGHHGTGEIRVDQGNLQKASREEEIVKPAGCRHREFIPQRPVFFKSARLDRPAGHRLEYFKRYEQRPG
ncbi:MAG: hypothetical protein BWY73_00614 [candidate division TA06 bacterium ADurb.Bin417]|uniref:Uncharacterized protein n=1 Tax=candidate division TA06 bacterium ADurb.Bin417 TaxID=1852828 RepID=A0A1V5MI07_UNCT6|nr:MAG: hypothetical protein BWY73_00614 [candidate division TA06 bacterium ADurb.Bin417]